MEEEEEEDWFGEVRGRRHRSNKIHNLQRIYLCNTHLFLKYFSQNSTQQSLEK